MFWNLNSGIQDSNYLIMIKFVSFKIFFHTSVAPNILLIYFHHFFNINFWKHSSIIYHLKFYRMSKGWKSLLYIVSYSLVYIHFLRLRPSIYMAMAIHIIFLALRTMKLYTDWFSHIHFSCLATFDSGNAYM